MLGLDQELFAADRDRYAVDGLDLDPAFGRPRIVNSARGLQEINDGRANEAIEDDCKTTDQDLPNAFGIQGFAEREEVFELRCA